MYNGISKRAIGEVYSTTTLLGMTEAAYRSIIQYMYSRLGVGGGC